ncbi:MAG: peptidylprolyl isomerase [Victivallales bacterium]|nr:peptidylprolyl isomerase [Victivallales bacterium]
MIISSFNRYFEKHGRKTYIVLGIIISVIFVFSLGGGMDSCGYREPGLKSFGKMYGKTLKSKETMEQMRRADIGYILRTGMSLGRNNGDSQLLQLALQRMRALHKAHELGLDKVSDAELLEAIQSQPIFGGKENFSKQRYLDFVNNYMIPNRMSGGDLDEIIKENLIIDRLEEKAVEGVEVTEDEINEYLEKYTISQYEYAMNVSKDSTPSEEEITKFFETRKGELTLDDQKKAVVATITVDDVLANANLKAQVEPKEEELKDMFEKGQAHLYKDKKYEDVKEAIRKQVSRRKASETARKAIADLAAKVAEKPAGEKPEEAIARFTKLATEAGAKIVTTDFFSSGDEIPGMKGHVGALARAIRALNQVGAATKEVATIGAFNVAILADQKPGEMPAAVNDEVKAKIIDKLVGEKAMAYFNEKIAPYKDKVAGLKSVWDLVTPFQQELEAKKLDEEAMMAEYSKYQEFLSDNVMPFFKEELRSAKIVAFKPATFEGRFEITEAEKKAEYESRKAEFEKKQVRMNKIVVNLDANADDAAKAAKKAKLTEALNKLKEGKEFKDLVEEYSEDTLTKSKQGDTGLVDVTTLDEAIAKAVLDMEINQVSGILESKNSMMIVKLAEKDMGKTYEDATVQAELTKSITAEKTKNLAADAAHAFSTRFTEACDQNDKAGAAKKALVEVFEELVAAGVPDAEIIDLPYSAQSTSIPGFGRETQLMTLLFSRTPDNPCTYMVAGQNASYVACLKDVKPSYLAIPSAEDPDSLNRLKMLYRKETAMAAVKKTAEEKAAAINKELAAGTPLDKAAGDIVFKPVAEAFDFMGVQQNRDLHAKDKMSLLKTLHRGKVGTVLEPVKTYSGYDLVYLDKRELKNDDDSKRLAEQIKTSLGNRKKGRKLAEYYEQLEIESNTQLVEGLIRQK